MDERKLISACEQVISTAKKAGATAVAVAVSIAENRDITVREGELDGMDYSQSLSVGVSAYIGGKCGEAASTSLDPADLTRIAKTATELARPTTKNPHRRLVRVTETPDATLAKGNALDLVDPSPASSLSQLREMALALDELAHASEGASQVESASAGYWNGLSVYATSTGFVGISCSTTSTKGVNIIAKNESEMQSGGDNTSAAHARDLRSDKECVRRANERARRMLGAAPIPTGIMPVILENEIAGLMMRALFSAIDAGEVFNGATFLCGKLGEQVMSKDISIVEMPHLPRKLGSAYFDNEGVATVSREIVSRGRLTTWASNIESAEKLGIAPTGHAGGYTRLRLTPGVHAKEELIASIDRGVLVTGVMGQGINIATGNFSVGAEGILIERGKIVRPVNKITIAGNLLDIWKTMIAGSDMTDRQGSNSPSLLIEKMTVGGM